MCDINPKTLDFHHKQKIRWFEKQQTDFTKQIQNLKDIGQNTTEIEKAKAELTKQEHSYYLNVMDLLAHYYHNQQHIPKPSANCEQNALEKFLDRQMTVDKTKILDEYMFRINHNTTKKKPMYDNKNKKCSKCNVSQILDTRHSAYVCEVCGECESVIIHPDKIPYVQKPFMLDLDISLRSKPKTFVGILHLSVL